MSFMALPQYQNEQTTGQPSSSRNYTKSRDTKRSKVNDDQLTERQSHNQNYQERKNKKATVTILQGIRNPVVDQKKQAFDQLIKFQTQHGLTNPLSVIQMEEKTENQPQFAVLGANIFRNQQYQKSKSQIENRQEVKKSKRKVPNEKFQSYKQASSAVTWLESQLISPQDMTQTLNLGNNLTPLNEIQDSPILSGSPSIKNLKDQIQNDLQLSPYNIQTLSPASPERINHIFESNQQSQNLNLQIIRSAGQEHREKNFKNFSESPSPGFIYGQNQYSPVLKKTKSLIKNKVKLINEPPISSTSSLSEDKLKENFKQLKLKIRQITPTNEKSQYQNKNIDEIISQEHDKLILGSYTINQQTIYKQKDRPLSQENVPPEIQTKRVNSNLSNYKNKNKDQRTSIQMDTEAIQQSDDGNDSFKKCQNMKINFSNIKKIEVQTNQLYSEQSLAQNADIAHNIFQVYPTKNSGSSQFGPKGASSVQNEQNKIFKYPQYKTIQNINGPIIIKKNQANKSEYLNVNESQESLGTKRDSGIKEPGFFQSFMLSNKTVEVQNIQTGVKVKPKNRIQTIDYTQVAEIEQDLRSKIPSLNYDQLQKIYKQMKQEIFQNSDKRISKNQYKKMLRNLEKIKKKRQLGPTKIFDYVNLIEKDVDLLTDSEQSLELQDFEDENQKIEKIINSVNKIAAEAIQKTSSIQQGPPSFILQFRNQTPDFTLNDQLQISKISTIRMITEPIQKIVEKEHYSTQVSPRNNIGTYTPEEESNTEQNTVKNQSINFNYENTHQDENFERQNKQYNSFQNNYEEVLAIKDLKTQETQKESSQLQQNSSIKLSQISPKNLKNIDSIFQGSLINKEIFDKSQASFQIAPNHQTQEIIINNESKQQLERKEIMQINFTGNKIVEDYIKSKSIYGVKNKYLQIPNSGRSYVTSDFTSRNLDLQSLFITNSKNNPIQKNQKDYKADMKIKDQSYKYQTCYQSSQTNQDNQLFINQLSPQHQKIAKFQMQLQQIQQEGVQPSNFGIQFYNDISQKIKLQMNLQSLYERFQVQNLNAHFKKQKMPFSHYKNNKKKDKKSLRQETIYTQEINLLDPLLQGQSDDKEIQMKKVASKEKFNLSKLDQIFEQENKFDNNKETHQSAQFSMTKQDQFQNRFIQTKLQQATNLKIELKNLNNSNETLKKSIEFNNIDPETNKIKYDEKTKNKSNKEIYECWQEIIKIENQIKKLKIVYIKNQNVFRNLKSRENSKPVSPPSQNQNSLQVDSAVQSVLQVQDSIYTASPNKDKFIFNDSNSSFKLLRTSRESSPKGLQQQYDDLSNQLKSLTILQKDDLKNQLILNQNKNLEIQQRLIQRLELKKQSLKEAENRIQAGFIQLDIEAREDEIKKKQLNQFMDIKVSTLQNKPFQQINNQKNPKNKGDQEVLKKHEKQQVDHFLTKSPVIIKKNNNILGQKQAESIRQNKDYILKRITLLNSLFMNLEYFKHFANFQNTKYKINPNIKNFKNKLILNGITAGHESFKSLGNFQSQDEFENKQETKKSTFRDGYSYEGLQQTQRTEKVFTSQLVENNKSNKSSMDSNQIKNYKQEEDKKKQSIQQPISMISKEIKLTHKNKEFRSSQDDNTYKATGQWKFSTVDVVPYLDEDAHLRQPEQKKQLEGGTKSQMIKLIFNEPQKAESQKDVKQFDLEKNNKFTQLEQTDKRNQEGPDQLIYDTMPTSLQQTTNNGKYIQNQIQFFKQLKNSPQNLSLFQQSSKQKQIVDQMQKYLTLYSLENKKASPQDIRALLDDIGKITKTTHSPTQKAQKSVLILENGYPLINLDGQAVQIQSKSSAQNDYKLKVKQIKDLEKVFIHRIEQINNSLDLVTKLSVDSRRKNQKEKFLLSKEQKKVKAGKVYSGEQTCRSEMISKKRVPKDIVVSSMFKQSQRAFFERIGSNPDNRSADFVEETFENSRRSPLNQEEQISEIQESQTAFNLVKEHAINYQARFENEYKSDMSVTRKSYKENKKEGRNHSVKGNITEQTIPQISTPQRKQGQNLTLYNLDSAFSGDVKNQINTDIQKSTQLVSAIEQSDIDNKDLQLSNSEQKYSIRKIEQPIIMNETTETELFEDFVERFMNFYSKGLTNIQTMRSILKEVQDSHGDIDQNIQFQKKEQNLSEVQSILFEKVLEDLQQILLSDIENVLKITKDDINVKLSLVNQGFDQMDQMDVQLLRGANFNPMQKVHFQKQSEHLSNQMLINQEQIVQRSMALDLYYQKRQQIKQNEYINFVENKLKTKVKKIIQNQQKTKQKLISENKLYPEIKEVTEPNIENILTKKQIMEFTVDQFMEAMIINCKTYVDSLIESQVEEFKQKFRDLKQIKINQQLQNEKQQKVMDRDQNNKISLIKRDALPYKYLMDQGTKICRSTLTDKTDQIRKNTAPTNINTSFEKAKEDIMSTQYQNNSLMSQYSFMDYKSNFQSKNITDRTNLINQDSLQRNAFTSNCSRRKSSINNTQKIKSYKQNVKSTMNSKPQNSMNPTISDNVTINDDVSFRDIVKKRGLITYGKETMMNLKLNNDAEYFQYLIGRPKTMAGIPFNTTKLTNENDYPMPILPALEQSLKAKAEKKAFTKDSTFSRKFSEALQKKDTQSLLNPQHFHIEMMQETKSKLQKISIHPRTQSVQNSRLSPIKKKLKLDNNTLYQNNLNIETITQKDIIKSQIQKIRSHKEESARILGDQFNPQLMKLRNQEQMKQQNLAEQQVQEYFRNHLI